jgi:hypothetical protein
MCIVYVLFVLTGANRMAIGIVIVRFRCFRGCSTFSTIAFISLYVFDSAEARIGFESRYENSAHRWPWLWTAHCSSLCKIFSRQSCSIVSRRTRHMGIHIDQSQMSTHSLFTSIFLISMFRQRPKMPGITSQQLSVIHRALFTIYIVVSLSSCSFSELLPIFSKLRYSYTTSKGSDWT